jgi:hypothetical protein
MLDPYELTTRCATAGTSARLTEGARPRVRRLAASLGPGGGTGRWRRAFLCRS